MRQCPSHFHPHQSLYFSRARSTETGGFNSLGSSVSEPEKEGLRLLLALLMTFSRGIHSLSYQNLDAESVNFLAKHHGK